MRLLTSSGLRRSVAAPAIASAASVASPPADADYQRYLQAHVRLGPIVTACAVWGLVLLMYFLALSPAKADPIRADDRMPGQFTTLGCYQLVQDAGRMIAWARWEQGFTLEKTRSAQFPSNTPAWMLDLVHEWITDAYQWKATDDQVVQWASELGNAQHLPHADQLSVHETTAIWLRRIARQCQARKV
jgi:hypothetical protein